MRECGKAQVEKVLNVGVFEPRRLCKGGPYAIQIGPEGIGKVFKRSVANVVANYKKEERSVCGAKKRSERSI